MKEKNMPTIEKHSEKVEAVQVEEPQFKDSDEVTVLFGYGKEPAAKQHYIDNITFVGGVARNVPYGVVKHWQNGTRPDGKLATSRIKVQAVLPNNATEADFIRVTGIKGDISDAHLSALVSGLDAAQLEKMLTPAQARALATRLGGR